MELLIALQFYDATIVGFAQTDWENSRYEKNARRVIYKGFKQCLGQSRTR